jgi:hypothetical protein
MNDKGRKILWRQHLRHAGMIHVVGLFRYFLDA